MEGEVEENILAELQPDKIDDLAQIVSAFDKTGQSKRPQLFLLHNRGPKYSRVQLCGSMDNWQVKHDLQFDEITN